MVISTTNCSPAVWRNIAFCRLSSFLWWYSHTNKTKWWSYNDWITGRTSKWYALLSNEAFFLNQNCSLVVWKYLGAYSFCDAVLVARYHQVFAKPIHKGGILDAASINFLSLKESHNLAFICSAAKFKPIIENFPFFLKPEKEQVCKKSKITRDNSLGLLKVEVIDICRGFGNQLLAKLELWRVWSCNCGDNMCNPLPLEKYPPPM